MSLSKAKNWFFNILCHPYCGIVISRLFNRRVPSAGLIIDTSSGHIAPANIARIFYRLYEKSEIGFVKRYLRPELDVVELGSSLGIVTLHIIKVQQPECKLLCVEANPCFLPIIKSNIHLNAPQKEVEILNRAINYTDQKQVNFRVDAGNLGSRIEDGVGTDKISVTTATLGDLISAYNIENYALVCDIEGAEVGIFMNDTAVLRRCLQLIIELHATEYAGQTYSVPQLREKIEMLHDFKLVSRRHDVYFFEKL